jgi:hypothetical protein
MLLYTHEKATEMLKNTDWHRLGANVQCTCLLLESLSPLQSHDGGYKRKEKCVSRQMKKRREAAERTLSFFG